jgi:hypothetical protein
LEPFTVYTRVYEGFIPRLSRAAIDVPEIVIK